MRKTLWKISVCLTACLGALVLAFAITSCKKEESKNYAVTFETYGGTAVEKIGINAGDKISAPAAPTKNNATFSGWYLDEDFEDEFPFGSALEGKNYTAYARWKVTVSYEVNGGTPISSVQKEAKDMLILPTPTAEGKIFYGWYSDAALTQQVSKMYTVPHDSVTLYAKWSKMDDGTAIDLMSGLTVNEPNSYTMETVEDGVKFTVLEGKGTYSYVYTPLFTDFTGYTVLHLVFKGTQGQSILFKLEGGGATAIEQKYEFTGELQEEFWTVSAANIGNNTSPESCQKFLFFINPGVAGSDSAHTEVTVQTVDFCKTVGETDAGQEVLVFNTTGGSFVNAVYGEKGSALTMPANPTKAGCTFVGWYTDKNCTAEFTETTMPEGPTMVYAKWENAEAYTVTFVTNCELTAEPVQVRPGLKIEVPALKVPGWTFIGWYNDEQLNEPSGLIMPEHNTTLYAKWLKLEDLSDKEHPYDITTEWTKDNANNGYTVSDLNGEMTVTVSTGKGQWNGIQKDLSGLDLTYVNALHIVMDGAVAGHSFTLFFYKAAGGYQQMEIPVTSEHFDEWIYIPISMAGSPKIKINYQNGKSLTEDVTLKFSKIELLNPKEKMDTVNLLNGWSAFQEGHYSVTESASETTITVNPAKTEWSYLVYDWSSKIIDFPNTREISVVINGPEGHTVMFKYNNKVEKSVALTGADQEIVITLTEPFSGAENCLIIFIDGNVSLPETAFDVVIKSFTLKVYHDETVYEDREIDLIDCTYTSFVPGEYTVEKTDAGLVLTATTSKGVWNPVNLDWSEINVDKAYEIRIKVQGAAGHKLSFKYNNDNALQTHVNLTGEEQDVVINVSNIDKTKALNIFIDVGVGVGGSTALTEDVSVTIKSIKLMVKAPAGQE